MAYTDLTGAKKINGLPADLDAREAMISNDVFLKNEVDNDEDLEALDRNILPMADDTYSIGHVTARIKEVFSTFIKANKFESEHGTSNALSFSFTGETTGFYRSSPGQISFVSGSVEPFVVNGAGTRVKTANNTQIIIESVSLGFEDTWGIGGDLNGFQIFNTSAGLVPVIKFFTDKILPLKQTQLPNGTLLIPSLSFSGESDTGLYKDSISSKASWVIGAVEKLTIDNNLLQFFGDQIVAKDGTEFLPSYSFENALDSGLAVETGGELILASTGGAGAKVHEYGFAPYKVKPNVITGPETDAEVNVLDISKLVIDATLGDISIKALTNGKEGQMLHLIMAEAVGTLTLRHNNTTSVDPLASEMLLKGSVDFVINADFGGIILSYDDGTWREAGRS